MVNPTSCLTEEGRLEETILMLTRMHARWTSRRQLAHILDRVTDDIKTLEAPLTICFAGGSGHDNVMNVAGKCTF